MGSIIFYRQGHKLEKHGGQLVRAVTRGNGAEGDDVTANAAAAAFGDPRFEPLTVSEYPAIRVEVSVLSTPEPMSFTSRADALAQLRPGVDGLILTSGRHRATFLPQVWAQLPSREEFVRALARKAGLAPDYWDNRMELDRYQVRSWAEPTPGTHP